MTKRDGELGGFWCAAPLCLLPTVENILLVHDKCEADACEDAQEEAVGFGVLFKLCPLKWCGA